MIFAPFLRGSKKSSGLQGMPLGLRPTKMVGVGLNYREHARELNVPLPCNPALFINPVSSLIGPDDAVVLPEQGKRVDFEA